MDVFFVFLIQYAHHVWLAIIKQMLTAFIELIVHARPTLSHNVLLLRYMFFYYFISAQSPAW